MEPFSSFLLRATVRLLSRRINSPEITSVLAAVAATALAMVCLPVPEGEGGGNCGGGGSTTGGGGGGEAGGLVGGIGAGIGGKPG